jgi:hypothetical protein
MRSCCCTTIQSMWRQRQARLLYRMQVRLVLLFHSSSAIQRVYRGHLQRLAFATALRTGCFTTVSDSSHDRAARKARDLKPVTDNGSAGRTGRSASKGGGLVVALVQRMRGDAPGVLSNGHCHARAHWPPSASQALACLRLIRFPGPRVLKRASRQQKERRDLANRILSSTSGASADTRVAPDPEIASIGISVVSAHRDALFLHYSQFVCFYLAGREPAAVDSANADQRRLEVISQRCCYVVYLVRRLTDLQAGVHAAR